MAFEQIATINNPAFKTGMGKNGKPWTLMQVTTDKNNLTTVFAPATVGDKLELTWDATYSSWKAQKVNERDIKQIEALREIYKIVAAIYKEVKGEDWNKKTEVVPEPAPPVEEIPTLDVGTDEISLSDIPF